MVHVDDFNDGQRATYSSLVSRLHTRYSYTGDIFRAKNCRKCGVSGNKLRIKKKLDKYGK